MKNLSLQLNSGFTIIEMLVSLALYTTVVTIAVGALLVLIAGSSRGQAEQSVMTTLTFALDSMTREIRTGSQYVCQSTTLSGQETFGTPNDCSSGAGSASNHGISFVEGGNSITGGAKRIAYYFDKNNATIMRRVGGADPESIISNTILVNRADFFVTGSTPLSAAGTDTNQPTVTIVIEATDESEPTAAPYIVQTTITQRELDI